MARLFAALPSLPRAELSRLTTRLIERMDEIDGDPDLEDDDPVGGSADDVGEVEEWRDGGFFLDRPQYGADQSLGPVNTEAATQKLERTKTAMYLAAARQKEHRRD